ncbi:uncharacterized protein SCHCODRAFT_02043412 [Schizophyllum commune H4-8]|uniref:uncharacterized protein n=1 Tax=Schizophyllum commune (strain H4-8 / FGSC 9210) TaxID=578458 RepID=UPI00215F1442|nr:uncharacterized protein SCHCODRAFT_02043412 [Schizophyllum commune H4-8]KAI5900767.1 hypothetical protein SCHCODRAFT_02043412 [Schizophyllum commune H4-8]
MKTSRERRGRRLRAASQRRRLPPRTRRWVPSSLWRRLHGWLRALRVLFTLLVYPPGPPTCAGYEVVRSEGRRHDLSSDALDHLSRSMMFPSGSTKFGIRIVIFVSNPSRSRSSSISSPPSHAKLVRRMDDIDVGVRSRRTSSSCLFPRVQRKLVRIWWLLPPSMGTCSLAAKMEKHRSRRRI